VPRTPLSDLLIVDADVHVHESPGGLAPYCDAPWDVALRNVADVPERYLDIPGFSPGGDGTLTARFPTSHEATRMVHTPEQMVAELREIHVDLAVLFPDHLLKLPVLPQADYAAALARAYNGWLAEEWTSKHDALLGAIVACPQDPPDAAREIERYADEPSMAAVYLPCGFDTEFARHSTSHTFSIIANLISMVSTGVVVRFPELRIGVTEAGISWMPFVCNRLDKEYLERRREVPFLKERPSTYLKRVYVATQPIEEPERLRDLVTLMELYDGEDTTIFASDWPHHDFDHPMKLNQVPFSEEQRRKVFGENALELFGIDRDGRRV
jgi:predicted TIM-barrel fold metal-dependent hydrolase